MNKKIGLALGSGGARGLAHIGVLKFLEENNIKIDYIAGTSMGAIIGGLYASGLSANEIEKIALETDMLDIFKTLFDPSLKRGFMAGNKMTAFIQENLKVENFEDCKIPFSCIATDIKTGERVLLNKGNIAEAIRASSSLPLIFKPVEVDKSMLTDGGLSEPVPVKTVSDMGADIVIAVNLDTHTFEEEKKPGWYDIAYNSINIIRHHLALLACEKADITLNIDLGVKDYWYKFDDTDQKITVGKKSMEKEFKKLLQLLSN